jgi:hypothetical protein
MLLCNLYRLYFCTAIHVQFVFFLLLKGDLLGVYSIIVIIDNDNSYAVFVS